MTPAELRTVLDKFGHEDAKILILISGTYWPLCDIIRSSMMTYTTKEEPDIVHSEITLVFQPCEGHDHDPPKPHEILPEQGN